jgi:hypothetical protein
MEVRMTAYWYYFGILPVMIVAGILVSRYMKKQALKRAGEVGVARLIHESFGHYFKLAPGEELVRFWGGLIYTGDLVPEYKDTLGDKVGRAIGNAALLLVGTTRVFHTGRVMVALTSHARVVVARDDENFCPVHYAAYAPGDPIYMAVDFAQQDPGKPTKEVVRFAQDNRKLGGLVSKGWRFLKKQLKDEKLAAPEMPRLHVPVAIPGVSEDIGFVLFGRDPGARMPAWMTGDVVDVLMRWRHDPIGTTAMLVAQGAPQGSATAEVTGQTLAVPMRAPSLA